MKYKYFIIFFLALFISSGHMAFGSHGEVHENTSVTSWIENFPIDIFGEHDNTFQEELHELMETEERLKKIQVSLEESMQGNTRKNNRIKIQIQEIENIQKDIESKIAENDEKIQILEDNLQKINFFIQKNREKIEDTKLFMRKILEQKYRYQIQENSPFSIHKLLGITTFGSLKEKKNNVYILQKSATELLELQKRTEKQFEKLQEKKNKNLQVKKHILDRLEKEKDELEETKVIKKTILGANISKQKVQNKITIIEKKKTTVSNTIESKFAEYEASLVKNISAVHCTGKNTSVCLWIKKYIESEKLLLKNNFSNENFMIPAYSQDGFGYHFRDQKYYHNFTTHHEGLDIVMNPGLPVKSMGNGYILMKQYPNGNTPGMVIIKHPHNFLSIIKGITPNNLALFSHIKTGDIIGTSGQYSDHSGKNNIHVELYVQGKLTDPLEKIDLSTLPATIIPERYGWKYIDDSKQKNMAINIDALQNTINFFHIHGNTEPERQSNFLSKYASPDFSDRALWVMESLSEKIDPTFIICIGFAESTLGNNLTTPGNIGNVGNNDSGGRTNFTDPVSGIRAIGSVLNNQFLGSYMTLDELSGWGNSKGPIYASSKTNWHENIVKCMSAIKGKYVGNTTKFRLTRGGLLIYEKEGFQPNILSIHEIEKS